MSENPLEIGRDSFVVAYVTAACATTVLYDFCLTFAIEVEQIWPMRMAMPKVLFLINRYVVLSMLVFNGIVSTRSNLSSEFCIFYLRWLDIVITISAATFDAILLTRALVLYRENRAIRVFACAVYIGGVLTCLAVTLNDYLGQKVHLVGDLNWLPGCYATSVPRTIAGYWIVSVVVESTLFVLVMSRVIAWSFDSYGIPPTLVLIARDSAVYFAAMFTLLIVNLFVFEYAPPNLSSLFVTPASTTSCIAGGRMLLNLRGAGRPRISHDSEFEMTDFNGMDWTTRRAASPLEFASDRAEIILSSQLSRNSATPSPETPNQTRQPPL